MTSRLGYPGQDWLSERPFFDINERPEELHERIVEAFCGTVGRRRIMISLGFIHLIIRDFLLSKRWQGGLGLLKDHPRASWYSSQVNDRQRRRYVKFDRVPMPFILFLQDAGVRFAKSDEKLRGITAMELEDVLVRSESDPPACVICEGPLKSLLKGMEYQFLARRNKELVPTGHLVAKYHSDYKYRQKSRKL